MSVSSPVPRGRALSFACLTLILGCASCGCPSFLNSNCSMDVDLALAGANETINDGRAFEVSVALLRQDDAAAALTNREWIRGAERTASANRSLEFTVQSGEIRIAGTPEASSTRYEIAEDGRSIEIDFSGLGHPEEGGYARLAVFTTMEGRLDDGPLIVPYGEIKDAGWDVVLEVGSSGVQVVRDEVQ